VDIIPILTSHNMKYLQDAIIVSPGYCRIRLNVIFWLRDLSDSEGMKKEARSCGNQYVFTMRTGCILLTFLHDSGLLSSRLFNHSFKVEAADVSSDLIQAVLHSEVP
jgi:hypothetical protein